MSPARRRPAARAEIVALPPLTRGLPAPPPQSLDPYLDAAARCFVRYGVRRTSIQDVADELGVNRTTVHRQLGPAGSMLRLYAARELHRLLNEMHRQLDLGVSPESIVRLLASAVALSRSHPVLAKVLADERDMVGEFIVDIDDVLGRIAAAIVPLLSTAMDAGLVARRDPTVVAQWLARIGMTAILVPPPGDLEPFLAEVLLPALTP